jgi:excisionase family DNA binding protein
MDHAMQLATQQQPVMLQQSQLRITVSCDEAMAALSIGRTMLYSLLADGSIASIKVGKKRLVLVSSINEWVQDQLSYGFGELKGKGA